MQTLPLISTIIPCFNQETYIAESIQSVLDQTYPRVEVIVVDDCSTDASLQRVKAFGNKVRVVEMETNSGSCKARNRGLLAAQGTLIQFHDSDDLLLPEKLSDEQRMFARDPQLDIVYSLNRLFQDGEDPNRSKHPQADREFRIKTIYANAERENNLALVVARFGAPQQSGFLFRRSALETYGAYCDGTEPISDRELAFRHVISGAKVACNPTITSLWRQYQSTNRMTSNMEQQRHRNVFFVAVQMVRLARENGKLDQPLSEAIVEFLMRGHWSAHLYGDTPGIGHIEALCQALREPRDESRLDHILEAGHQILSRNNGVPPQVSHSVRPNTGRKAMEGEREC